MIADKFVADTVMANLSNRYRWVRVNTQSDASVLTGCCSIRGLVAAESP